MIPLLSTIGFLLSVYGFSIVEQVKKRKEYHPVCDISKHVSCTKALMSKSGSLAGFPNPLFGIIFYPVVALLYFFSFTAVLQVAVLVALFGSLYLAYISYVVQKNFCVLCTGIYAVNILLTIAAFV